MKQHVMSCLMTPFPGKRFLPVLVILKPGKLRGPDEIVSEMLKHADALVINYLLAYFNKLFESGIFPTEWSKSIIVPIYKKGDINRPDNYRGIALTSIVSKVYTYILNRRLTKWAKKGEKMIFKKPSIL